MGDGSDGAFACRNAPYKIRDRTEGPTLMAGAFTGGCRFSRGDRTPDFFALRSPKLGAKIRERDRHHYAVETEAGDRAVSRIDCWHRCVTASALPD
jgi:hypothetical protein